MAAGFERRGEFRLKIYIPFILKQFQLGFNVKAKVIEDTTEEEKPIELDEEKEISAEVINRPKPSFFL